MLMLMLKNISVVQGLIANKALILWGGYWGRTTKRQNDKDDKMTKQQNDKKTITLFLRAPLVASALKKKSKRKGGTKENSLLLVSFRVTKDVAQPMYPKWAKLTAS